MAGNKPVLSIKSEFARTVRIALWANQKGYSLTIQKSNQKPNSTEWETKELSMFPSDALALVRALNQTLEFIDANPLARENQGGGGGAGRSSGPVQAPPMNDQQLGALATTFDFDDDDIPF